MTRQMQATAFDEIAELLAEHGFDGMARAVTVLLNEVMKLERARALGAAPYERSEQRQGYANGFKPKTLHTRLGPLTVEVPQTRGVEFYPSALEGIRSERALKLAVGDVRPGGLDPQGRRHHRAALRPGGDQLAGQPGRPGPRLGAGEVAVPPDRRDPLPDP